MQKSAELSRARQHRMRLPIYQMFSCANNTAAQLKADVRDFFVKHLLPSARFLVLDGGVDEVMGKCVTNSKPPVCYLRNNTKLDYFIDKDLFIELKPAERELE